MGLVTATVANFTNFLDLCLFYGMLALEGKP